MKKWITGKVIKAATGLAVTTVAVGALANASVLESIFVPEKFSKFENEQDNEQYRYAAGEGEDVDLADKNGEQEKTSGEDSQKINQINQLNQENQISDEEEQSVIGVVDNSWIENENKLPGTVAFTDSEEAAKISIVSGKNGTESTQSQGGTGSTDSSGKNENSGNQTGDNSSSKEEKEKDETKPDVPQNPDVPNTPSTPENPENPEKPDTPDIPQSSWEEIQLKPKDPVLTEYGTLTSLKAEFIKSEYAVGEKFEAKNATVTATFLDSAGNSQTKELEYGENDGYQVSFSTTSVGDRIAVFSYKGMSARAHYTVLNSYVEVYYMARYEGDNESYYISNFPGEPMKKVAGSDFETIAKLVSFPNNYIETGNIIDLSEVHSRMIAYLGDDIIKENFQATTSGGNYATTVFLEQDEEGYLVTMLEGFRETSGRALLNERSYTYYPAKNWNDMSKNVLNLVKQVPQGYKIRRVVESEDKMADYRADQVLEAYTGNSEVLEVPMGVTKIDLKAVSKTVKCIKIPQSVTSINIESLVEFLPNLEQFEYEDDTVSYKEIKIEDGILYNGDGTTLLLAPAKKKEVIIPAKVKKLGNGCLSALSENSVVQFKSENMLELEGKTGYHGTFIVPASKYETIGKSYMLALKEESNSIRFKTSDGNALSYYYDADDPKLCDKKDASILVAFCPDVYGKCQIGKSIQEIAAGAFLGCTKITDLEIGEEIKMLQEGSLVLPQNVKEITIIGSDLEISSMVFGNPEDGAKVPDIKIYVKEEDYEHYLKKWSQSLDTTYGEGTAKKLLSKEQKESFFENGAKYETIEKNGRTGYRLVKLYEKDMTAFAVKEGTLEIASDAFLESEKLEILYLPKSVEGLGNVLENCKNLESIASENPKFDSEHTVISSKAQMFVAKEKYESFDYEDGVLYGISKTKKNTLLNVRTDYDKELIVKEQTEVLAKEACKGCMQIKEIISLEPEVLKEIQEECFVDCSALELANFFDCTELTVIERGTFKNCSSLQSLILPNSITEIADEICYGCESLSTVDTLGVKKVGEQAFYGCSSLIVFTDTAYLETVGRQAFYGCFSLKEIVFGEKISNMGEECFANCTGLRRVELNGMLTGISRYCFYGCSNLTEVTLGETQKSMLRVIGVQAFSECKQLEKLDLGKMASLEQMGERVFEGCQKLTTISLPEGLKKIPDYCFDSCDNLSILRINGETVPELGEKIFGDALPGFLHIWVEKDRVEEYRNAYKESLDNIYGEGITQKTLGENNEKQEVVKGVLFELTEEGRVLKSASSSISADYTIPSDTVRVEAEAFMNCDNLEELTLPKEADIVLGDRCFKGCKALKKINLEGNVSLWGEETFMDCTAVSKVYIGSDETIIERIGTRAFKNCTGLDSEGAVEFRGIIENFGRECFSGCSNLPSVGMTELARNNLKVLEDSTFEDCTKLRVFLTSKYKGLETIGNYVFKNCDTMKQPSIPAGVTSIGEGCFMDCDALAYVSFYGAIEEYPKDCFKNCPNLIRTGGTAAAFSGLKRIGENAYEGCVSLTSSSSWNLGRYADLEEIGDFAFRGCSLLADSTLSASVVKLGEGVFDECKNLNKLILQSPVPPEMGMIFPDRMSENFKVLVPDSMENGDNIYLTYFETLSQLMGEEKTYQILDSVSDGAKERNTLLEKEIVSDKEAEEVKEQEEELQEELLEEKELEEGEQQDDNRAVGTGNTGN